MSGCKKQGKQDINPVAVPDQRHNWTPDDVPPRPGIDFDINLRERESEGVHSLVRHKLRDFINVTATRGHTAPKAKPEWKVRTAPKLPPKPVPEDHSGAPRPPAREKLTSTRQSLAPPKQSKAAAGDSSDAASQTSEKAEKRKPPKLGAKKQPAA
ncbi:hypothetical protein LTS15_006900 [Exophiala xenobiotica]|nr:hypothetical protein LTS15_006900 [Exophiala xenobiotica]